MDTATVDLVFLEYSLNDGYVVRRNAAALEPGGSCPIDRYIFQQSSA